MRQGCEGKTWCFPKLCLLGAILCGLPAVWQEKVRGMGQGSCAANIGADVVQKEAMGIYFVICKSACVCRSGLQPEGLSR